MTWLLILVTLWCCVQLLILAVHARELRALWGEPVLRHPVLIIESDDWGAGPLEQAHGLRLLADRLSSFADATGQPPVMTLALVLAIPDGNAIRASGRYADRTLEDPLFSPILKAIRRGVEKGVFALQLHGLEHYWPPSLMADKGGEVREWLLCPSPRYTEELPSHLQSRWTDASVLPSLPLPDEAIRSAVNAETTLFYDIFGFRASVAVPPTFVWDAAVEAAWAENGIEFVITPGTRNSGRDAGGRPAGSGERIHNATAGQGVHYLVRNDYFEPLLGHTADQALAALSAKTRLGRPCLLETHRFNFTGEKEPAARAMGELSRLLESALQTHPDLRFVSTAALGRAFIDRDPQWVERRPGPRLTVLVRRLGQIPRLGKLARLSGLTLVLSLLAVPCRRKQMT